MIKKLSEQDRRTLEVFSMYLQSYGSKVGKFSIEVQTDNEVYWDYSYWGGDSTRISIESYDAIDELLKRIFHENEDTMLENFGGDDRGSVVAIVNCNDRTLTFKADIYVMGVNYTGDNFTPEDFYDDISREWFNDRKGAYVSGTVNYEGSGDSGYVESDIIYNDGTREDIPASLEEWMYGKLSNYGGWEINEGSQGNFHFNFEDNTIVHEHGENYESEETVKIPLAFKF